ncbi:MAG: type II toxin-antitoxin system PemK/MazF family toxin [Tepidiformaceae bacterium]
MQSGEIVLLRMPADAGRVGRVRPAIVVVANLRGMYPSALLAGISSAVERSVAGWDILIASESPEFRDTGLHVSSVIRPSWLVTVPSSADLPLLGTVPDSVVRAVRSRIADALEEGDTPGL